MRVRVVTYNVQSFRGGVEIAASVVAAEEPDLVLLQECGPKRTVRRFANALDMGVGSSHRRFSRVRNAILFRSPWQLVRDEVVDLSREGRTLPRGAFVASLRRLGSPLVVVSTHLGLSSPERERHVRELADIYAAESAPVIVGIDLNEGPEAPAARWMADRLYDAFAHAGRGPGETFPARVPTARIDYLFVNQAIRPLRAWVSTAPDVVTASDHRPVVADLELEGSKVEP